MQLNPAASAPRKNFSIEGFSVAEALEDRARSMRKRRKRVRTRAVLLAVAAREIEESGYDSLTVDHIANAAGMVRGTFYLYFHSRSDIAAAVLRKYWALMRACRPRGGSQLSLRASIHRANAYSVKLAARNPGLLAAREVLLREDPSVARRIALVNRMWTDRIVRDLLRRGIISANAEDFEFQRLKVRAVINMSDTLLGDVHLMSGWEYGDKPLSQELVVRVMDDLWYRALYMPAQANPV